MRELTKNEKKIVTEIVKKCVPDSTATIGDIIMNLYNINFMKEYLPSRNEEKFESESDYSSVCFEYKTYNGRKFQAEIYEAILLLLLLKKEGYIFMNYSSFINSEGQKGNRHEMMSLLQDKDYYEERRIFDIFPDTKLWILLNSHCIVTNSLIDYSKDFKTEEQRRFRTSIRYTWIAILISLISCVITCFIGCK
jgi:hypothetical protein